MLVALAQKKIPVTTGVCIPQAFGILENPLLRKIYYFLIFFLLFFALWVGLGGSN